MNINIILLIGRWAGGRPGRVFAFGIGGGKGCQSGLMSYMNFFSKKDL
jgi:hypothetical protein